MEKVSIIVPIYNSEKYIEATICSIVKQLYKNIEVVLVDDGSTDASIEIANSVLAKNKFDYKIIHQENKGLATARNTGFRHSSGQFVCFVDSDDIIDQYHVMHLIKSIKGISADIAYCDFETVCEKNRFGEPCDQQCEYQDFQMSWIRDMFRKRKIKLLVCAMIFKRSLLSSIDGPFTEGMRYGEDADFIWRVLYTRLKIGYAKVKTYKYLLRNNSLMRTFDAAKIKCFFEIFSDTIKKLQAENPNDSFFLQSVYCRIRFAQLRSTAMCTSYSAFKGICEEVEFKTSIQDLKMFDDARVRILIRIFEISPYLFWEINNLVNQHITNNPKK